MDRESIANLDGTESILVFTKDRKIHYIRPETELMAEFDKETLVFHLLPIAFMTRFFEDPKWVLDLADYTVNMLMGASNLKGKNDRNS